MSKLHKYLNDYPHVGGEISVTKNQIAEGLSPTGVDSGWKVLNRMDAGGTHRRPS